MGLMSLAGVISLVLAIVLATRVRRRPALSRRSRHLDGIRWLPGLTIFAVLAWSLGIAGYLLPETGATASETMERDRR